jgi:hypothetical protein
MEELVPVVLGVVLGVPISLVAARRLRFALSAAAVLLSGFAATVLSGEYRYSWVYLLLDLGEAALGLAFGLLVEGRIRLRRAAAPLRRAAEPSAQSERL